MTISQMKQLAKQKLHGNWGMAVIVVFVAGLISAVASSAFGILELVISGPLTVGLCGFFLAFLRDEKPEFEKLFKGFNNFATNFIVGLLVYLFTFLWSLLFIIPGIIASYAYSMTFFIQHDNPEMAETDAIKASKEMMKGHKWELFVLDLSFIGWYLLGILTFGILFLFVTPYHNAARAAFYENLLSQQNGNKEDSSEPFAQEDVKDEAQEDVKDEAQEEVPAIEEAESDDSQTNASDDENTDGKLSQEE